MECKHHRGLHGGGGPSAGLCKWGHTSLGRRKGEDIEGRDHSLSRLQRAGVRDWGEQLIYDRENSAVK